MAMNENEGSSAYPPNPDVKSGSCLIAGFHQLSEVRPSYWNAYRAESGATFSIDMVRLKLSFINGKDCRLSKDRRMYKALMTCCAMRSGRRMRGTATTLHRRGRIAGGLDDVL